MSNTAIELDTPGSNPPSNNSVLTPYRESIPSGTFDREPSDSSSWLVPDLQFRSPVLSNRAHRLAGKYELLQRWEGYVISVNAGEVRCKLVDKTEDTNPDEEVTISLMEFDPAERELAKPGAIFYWSIRYADYGRGREKISLLRFRRLPVIDKEVINQAEKRGQYLEGIFEK
ncbi:hypothetical protein [Thiolapillus sp.]|uniref:hypothetical protein n=1 Tax=Thiolapillus sp. TaxID=2017437 RepID=UPI003AF85769